MLFPLSARCLAIDCSGVERVSYYTYPADMSISYIARRESLPKFSLGHINLTSSHHQALIKGATEKDYPYLTELIGGHEVTKRMAESVNETIRQHSNISIVAELQVRVQDWKTHHISEFGNLLLEGRFKVTKGELDREYEVYLFEKMILCCKEILPDKKDKRAGKSGSLLKKQQADKHISGPPKKNPLSLKGRIYVNNLTHLQKVGADGESITM
jgi:cell division control protein 24